MGYIDIDSAFRDRARYPSPSDFVMDQSVVDTAPTLPLFMFQFANRSATGGGVFSDVDDYYTGCIYQDVTGLAMSPVNSYTAKPPVFYVDIHAGPAPMDAFHSFLLINPSNDTHIFVPGAGSKGPIQLQEGALGGCLLRDVDTGEVRRIVSYTPTSRTLEIDTPFDPAWWHATHAYEVWPRGSAPNAIPRRVVTGPSATDPRGCTVTFADAASAQAVVLGKQQGGQMYARLVYRYTCTVGATERTEYTDDVQRVLSVAAGSGAGAGADASVLHVVLERAYLPGPRELVEGQVDLEWVTIEFHTATPTAAGLAWWGHSLVCPTGRMYTVELPLVMLPNITLSDGRRLVDTMCLYAELSQEGASLNRDSAMVTNRPAMSPRALFKLHVLDFFPSSIAAFVKVGCPMSQVMYLSPHQPLRFRLLDNTTLEPVQWSRSDTQPPAAPDPLVQVTALWSITPISPT